MVLEVRHLRMLDAIRREGSVSRAAGRLHLTQPAVSHALKDLESRLGVTLFRRQQRRMVPTPEGERLIQSAEVVLDELARAEHDLDQYRQGHQGVIRITTECYTCYSWLPGLLRRFGDGYPGIDLQIVPEAKSDPLTAVLEHRVDLAIMHTKPPASVAAARRLFADELVAILPADHRLAGRSHLVAADFGGEHLLNHGALEDSAVHRQVLGPAGVVPARSSVIPLTEAILHAVRGGIGIAVIARWLVDPEIEAGNVAAVRVTPKGLRRTWWVVTLPYRADMPARRELVAELRRHAHDAAWACAR